MVTSFGIEGAQKLKYHAIFFYKSNFDIISKKYFKNHSYRKCIKILVTHLKIKNIKNGKKNLKYFINHS